MADQLASTRLDGIGEYYFSQKLREIDRLKQAGAAIINLGIGSPDMAPPQSVKEVLANAMQEADFHRYQSYKGIPELRSAFADWYGKYYHVTLDPDSEVLPLIGSKEGIMHISMALLDPGDGVLIPNPGYPTYASVTKLSGGVPRPYDLVEENNYWPNFKVLEDQDLSNVKLMWVNYPHMPTGTAADDKLFSQLIEFSKKHGIILINDNPYSFTMTDTPRSILKQATSADYVLELNSLSKSHNMSGWRMGALCGNSELVSHVLTFKSNMDSGMFKPIMRAAIEALKVEKDWYQQLNAQYAERKKQIIKIIQLLTCRVRTDQVGMFVWARIPEGFENGASYADWLLKKYEFFVPPGIIFGSQGDQYIRFSLCSPIHHLNEVLERISVQNEINVN